MSRLLFAVCSTFALASALFAAEPRVYENCSPNGEIAARLTLENGVPKLALSYRGETILAPSPLALDFEPALDGGVEFASVRTVCRLGGLAPSALCGENDSVRDDRRGWVATLREVGGERRESVLEIRLYDEGAAFRFLLPESPDRRVVGESTRWILPPDADAWPIFSTEGTYPKDPAKLGELDGDVFPPLTIRTPGGAVASILEIAGDDWPRVRLTLKNRGELGFKLLGAASTATAARSVAKRDGAVATPWRVLALAPNEAQLVENAPFLRLLAPPRARDVDFSWVATGKTLSNESNCSINDRDLKSMVDFAAANGMKYVQIDWGWYGTEWVWSDEDCAKWAETNPESANDLDWRRNAQADPTRVAKGLVPYLPTWKSATTVDLDLPELVRYGKEKGVGICLYVNDKMLKKANLDELFALYERWGIAGLKPGFVRYGSQEDEAAIRRMVATAAKRRLWLCVHDEYLPDGFSEAFPNLLSIEGGGGEEGNHPAWHDVAAPFARGLVGPFDFTPRLYQNNAGKSRAHQLSLLATLYNPAPTIRGGWAIRDAKPEDGFGDAFGSELEFLKKIPTDWAETKVLDAEIGRRIVVARRARGANDWFFAATNGPEKAAVSVDSSRFLQPNASYRMTLWTDAPEDGGGPRPTVRTEKIVRSGDRVEFEAAPAGGAVAIFERVD